jgi:hypothetical protein
MTINTYWSLYKVPAILVRFKETWIFSTGFLNVFKYKIRRKMRKMGADLFHLDRRTDMLKLSLLKILWTCLNRHESLALKFVSSVVEWIRLLFHVPKVSGLNFSPDIDYPDF